MEILHSIYCHDPIDKIGRLIGGNSVGKIKKILDADIITQRENGEIFCLPKKCIFGFDGKNLWLVLSEPELVHYKMNGGFDFRYFSFLIDSSDFFVRGKWMVN